MSIAVTSHARRLAGALRMDLPGPAGTPRLLRFLVAAATAVALSLLACAVIATATRALVPALGTYEHLQVRDWARLTVVGILLASLGWPTAGLLWSRARRPFLVLTALVTLLSLAPDLWILRQGQPADGVLALALMHVAVAVVSYPALVLIAPQRRRSAPSIPSVRGRTARTDES